MRHSRRPVFHHTTQSRHHSVFLPSERSTSLSSSIVIIIASSSMLSSRKRELLEPPPSNSNSYTITRREIYDLMYRSIKTSDEILRDHRTRTSAQFCTLEHERRHHTSTITHRSTTGTIMRSYAAS